MTTTTPATMTLIVHAWNQPARLARLLATLPEGVVQVIVSEGPWQSAGGTIGGGPGDHRPGAHAAAGPQVPALDALSFQAGLYRSDLAATGRALHEAVLPVTCTLRTLLQAEDSEAASRVSALNRAGGEWAVLLDPFDLPPRGWWEALRAFLEAHPRIGAVSAPTVQSWWGGEVIDQHITYRIVAVRRQAVYGVPFGGEYEVRAAHATVHFAPIVRDVMGEASTALLAAARAAKGMQGDVHRELFEGAYGAARDALVSPAFAPVARRAEAVTRVLDAGAAWMVLTGGPAPAFTWRDGTLVALRGRFP